MIIPESARPEMLKQIHDAHLGVEKCKNRAIDVLLWPKMGDYIEQWVNKCKPCLTYKTQQRKDPMNPHPVSSRP